jgi:GNAT superfamily N-acetyltransferase
LAKRPGDLTIRPLHLGDDLEAELDLRHRAFGPRSGGSRDSRLAELRASIAAGRVYGAWDSSRTGHGGGDPAAGAPVLVGSAFFYEMKQWWHGRALPMAGVAGVKVAPEVRGRGVGRVLMSAVLGVLAEGGYPISVLYPATAPLYRSLGWEMAGGYYQAEIAGRSVGALLAPDPQLRAWSHAGAGTPDADEGLHVPALRRVGAAEAEEVIAVLGAVHAMARDCGPGTFDAETMRRWLASPDIYGYLGADGFLAYGWDGTGHEIEVYTLEAASARTARALWGIVSSHASVAKTVRATLGPNDPIGWLTREPDLNLRMRERWMLRVLNAPAAVAGRGFPASVAATVPLQLADPELPVNAGPHTLSVRAGQGALTPGITASPADSRTAPPVALGPRGFAALFAGTPMATLRTAGLAADGDPGTDAALDAVFAATPYLLDYF